jgi:membrane protein implicated in regulation of membrane protease activity
MLANPRHMGVALASGIAIMFAGAIAFAGSSEAAVQAFAVVGFVTVFAVFHFLDERANRQKKKRAQ